MTVTLSEGALAVISISKLLALGCALAVAGCAQGSLGGSPGAFGSSGLSALPATSSAAARAGRAPVLGAQARQASSGDPLLYDFQGDPDGANPYAGLANVGGTLYGTTYQRGANNLGAIFSTTTSGKEMVVHSFSGGDGEYPEASLVDVNGTLYGTAAYGSGSAYGDVSSYNPASGTFKVVHSFQSNNIDGVEPASDLTYPKGALYGTTEGGGDAGGYGTVYKVQLSGKKSGQESIVYSFRGSISGPDGARPLAGVLYHDGSLYGTTNSGGAEGEGTLFSIALATGKEKVLHSFGATDKDGYEPQADLLLYKNVLYAFDPYQNSREKHEDGLRPLAGLTNVDGTFYGTTLDSAPDGYGTVFSVAPAGAEQVPLVVGGCSSCPPWPESPAAALIDVGSVLYSTSIAASGSGGDGTVFDLPI
jgi:uncharacterized repeat protein (TIGR03803 family)